MNALLDRLADLLGPLIERAVRRRASLVEHLTSEVSRRLLTRPEIFGGGWDRVVVGQNVKLVNALLNVSGGRITIGDNTFFGHNVSILAGTHNFENAGPARQVFASNGQDIKIGAGVWIASNAVVLGPCVIGDNAVVAAGAVVAGGDLEANALYAGVPARKIRGNLVRNIGVGDLSSENGSLID